MSDLSHLDEHGKVKMVDVSGKPATIRRAVASATVILSEATIAILKAKTSPKGDVLEIARIAGIMGAKGTSDLIPLCHPIALSKIDVQAGYSERGIYLESEVVTESQTGVEMEALTAVSIAALTIYDMCKAVQKDIEISEIRLESKSGGKQDFARI